MKKTAIILFLLSILNGLFAQNNESLLRSSGKIYIVVGIIIIIFCLIVIYLIRLDKKISALEKNNK